MSDFAEPVFDDPRLLKNCPTCVELMRGGSWERIPGDEIRWVWTGDKHREPSTIVPAGSEILVFAASHPDEKIALIIGQDGGLISYRRQNGSWLHTISSLSAFRKRVFELNLVPLEELGRLLKRVHA